MNPNKYLKLVAEFHSVFRYRQPEPITPDLLCSETNELRPRLLLEELSELKDAVDANDRVEQLDALCDAQYVLSGAVLAWGYRALIENTKITTELRKIADMDRHIMAMSAISFQMGIHAELELQHQVFNDLCVLQGKLARAVWHLVFSPVFDAAFEEVHRSNMSKLWDTCDYRAEGVYQMDAAPNGKWIARRGDGKIIKSPSYSPAQLERFV